jgi:hypothetical protein
MSGGGFMHTVQQVCEGGLLSSFSHVLRRFHDIRKHLMSVFEEKLPYAVYCGERLLRVPNLPPDLHQYKGVLFREDHRAVEENE